MSLKLKKGSKQRTREQCKARTKVGGPCQAPALEGGLCFCHARSTECAKAHPIFAANAIGFLAGILLKALDQRFEERLADLEAVTCGKRGTDTEVFEFRSAKEPPHEKPSKASEGD
jgi:hypothetical protein